MATAAAADADAETACRSLLSYIPHGSSLSCPFPPLLSFVLCSVVVLSCFVPLEIVCVRSRRPSVHPFHACAFIVFSSASLRLFLFHVEVSSSDVVPFLALPDLSPLFTSTLALLACRSVHARALVVYPTASPGHIAMHAQDANLMLSLLQRWSPSCVSVLAVLSPIYAMLACLLYFLPLCVGYSCFTLRSHLLMVVPFLALPILSPLSVSALALLDCRSVHARACCVFFDRFVWAYCHVPFH